MITWLTDLPWVFLIIVVIGFSGTIGVVGLWLAQRWAAPRFRRASHQNEVTGVVHAGILIIYGLVLALLAVAVYENHSEVTRICSAEAVDIAELYRDAGGYPEPTRTHLRTMLKNYTESIIHEAWPLQRKGKVPEGGVAAMDRVQAELFVFEPSSDGQRALHQETLRAFNTMIQARRLRLDAVAGGLPAPMWAVVLVGALMTLASALFFDVKDLGLHRVMVVLLASIMGLMIFMIAFYDRPYRGNHGIKPDAYELVYDHLMQR